MYDTLGRIMKKTIVRIGAFVYVIGMVMVAFSLIGPPRTVTESYQVPNSSEEMNESVTVSPGIFIRMLNLTEGHSVHIQVEVTAGGDRDIDSYVTDGTKIHIVDIRVTLLTEVIGRFLTMEHISSFTTTISVWIQRMLLR